MADLAFGIDSAEAFLEKLKAEQAEVYQAPANPRHSINAALNAYHMIDWIWAKSIKPLSHPQRTAVIGKVTRSKTDFTAWAIQDCSDLELMRAISNGSKHLAPDDAVASTGKSVADWSGDGDWARESFDVSRLVLVANDGKEIPFEDALARVVEWCQAVLDRVEELTVQTR